MLIFVIKLPNTLPKEYLLKGKIGTIDLLVQTCSDQLL